jgi:hypothetical protein
VTFAPTPRLAHVPLLLERLWHSGLHRRLRRGDVPSPLRVLKSGGKVLGKVRHPFPGTDLSSFLLQAKASGAKIIGLANAGGNTINSIKQASEFGIVQGGQKLAAS